MKNAKKVVQLLSRHQLKIAFAESCTGGLLAVHITSIPGSSKVLDLAVVTYANFAKTSILGVSEHTLFTYGAVSAQTAKEMVIGLKNISLANICISVTGIAGPGGGTTEKPVGMVYIGYDLLGKIEIEQKLFMGSRKNIRQQTTEHIFKKILVDIKNNVFYNSINRTYV